MAHAANYQILDHVWSNKLVVVMPAYAPKDRGHYICYPCRQNLPARTRVFIDFMTDEIRAIHQDCTVRNDSDTRAASTSLTAPIH